MNMQENLNVAARAEEIEAVSTYEAICDLVDIDPVGSEISIDTFRDANNLAETNTNERLTAAINVFLDMASSDGQQVSRIDKLLLDDYIAKVDRIISEQLDEILHHENFQKVESAWRSLRYLINRCPNNANVKVELLDVDKETLRDDFEESPDTTQSVLYKQVYTAEYDTPGGEPISTMVSNFEFDCSAPDVSLLQEISRVSAAAHCPFLASVGSKFFLKDSLEEVSKIQDLRSYMERAEFQRWKNFRESEDSRYIGLAFPRFLLRLPYGDLNPIRNFNYQEEVTSEDHERYLWGNATFAFAANVIRSFHENGWSVNIRGPQSGGRVENLPLHSFEAGRGQETKIPTEVLISETKELEFANQGFIPLSYYKNSDFACFFSANSAQKPQIYETPEASANARINSRLPYIYLVSRIAHYMKVLQRENIGSSKPRHELEQQLNDWLGALVTKMNNPDESLIATHPLKDAEVNVAEIPGNPGYYRVSTYVVPHFQVEGIDVRLALVGQMPGEK
ncbi:MULTISPECIES: type VI secretion system contractile sheath large subunit [Pseudoalteromonas]|uniref:ImpC n=3 Tax=Pseudoalteromonas luteoviolacea TaxID=43657 RepID=A0A023PZE7_9GAMM|nr:MULTISPECIES: type VI secretion system contractile sheath large subunit [Pseudoalteromonas]AHX39920.1 ImpC [Pseudoalteromonas luteoviolacea]AOT10928.1 type VI secretion protein [Pseudoalteromonas luteoviolacea]AOT15908.1 type VI secretion protein [Pseudoalteromonas luteoviolacea]AOT20749.1 type VI secretion protein [Pseudoalteromonas luteoviolacea]KID56052.1 type VI secretion protein [Pseudoalteromonas luteoviolacea]